MVERKLNEKESLELITQMIKNTQRNVDVGGGNQFIVWGVSILATSIVVLGLLFLTENHLFQFAWFLIPVIGSIWQRVAGNRDKIITHMDKMLKTLWMVCGVFCVSIPLLAVIFNYFHQETILDSNVIFTLIPMIEIVIVSLCIAVSGIILSSKPLRVAGFLGMCISFLTLTSIPYASPYTFAIWSIACLIIPGIKLNRTTKQIKRC